MQKIVLGLGNTILTDDGVGIYVTRAVAQQNTDPTVSVVEAEMAGFALIELLEGFDLAIIVDAFIKPDAPPGQVLWFNFDTNYQHPTSHLVSGHQIDLSSAVQLGRHMGAHFPETILIIGIVIENDTSFAEHCTPAVQHAIQPAAELVLKMLNHPEIYR